MPIQTTSKIWHNGNMIPWEDATLHVMSHVIHYGSSVFEGIRCYQQPNGAAVFRLPEHMQRLLDSAKIYRMEIPFNLEELCAGVVDLIEANGVAPCYIRPIALRGYGEIGVSPKGSPVALAKAGANYMNSQLIKMEAEVNGYQEGIGLDVNGLVSEGSGENIFVVRNGVIYTPPLSNSALSGITRDSVLTIARHLGLQVIEQSIPREMLYIADEVSPIRSIDKIVVGDGKTGELTKKIADEFFGIANGLKPDRFGWLTPVKVQAGEPVSA